MTARRSEPRSLLSRAVALLARREHSRAELARKLKRHAAEHADPAELERVLDDLERSKLLSDDRYAAALTSSRSQRYGDARLKFDLRNSGVRGDVASAALASVKGTELSRARALWQRRFGALPADAAERGRQGRFLQARGFSSETIQRVLRGAADDDSV
jgi:regulatory protein